MQSHSSRGAFTMRKGLAANLVSFWLIGSSNVWAQDVVDWVEPAQQRITVVANADEHRQVRFTGGWETADYVVFEWRDLSGEMVYLTANDDSVSIDFPLTAGEISSTVSYRQRRRGHTRQERARVVPARDGLRPAVYGHRQPAAAASLLYRAIRNRRSTAMLVPPQSHRGPRSRTSCAMSSSSTTGLSKTVRRTYRRPTWLRRANSRLGKTTKANRGV